MFQIPPHVVVNTKSWIFLRWFLHWGGTRPSSKHPVETGNGGV